MRNHAGSFPLFKSKANWSRQNIKTKLVIYWVLLKVWHWGIHCLCEMVHKKLNYSIPNHLYTDLICTELPELRGLCYHLLILWSEYLLLCHCDMQTNWVIVNGWLNVMSNQLKSNQISTFCKNLFISVIWH